MKIDNISANTSIKLVVTLAIICITLTIIAIVCYLCMTTNNYSVWDFFNWYVSVFKVVFSDDKFGACLIFIFLPIIFYGCLISSIVQRNKALKEFNSSLNLKSIEFLQGRMNFNFNMPQCNVTCDYSEIEKLEMILHTIRVSTKHGSYPAVSEIELKFSVLNGKTFTLFNVPSNVIKFVYSVIDYSRGMQNFSYCFKGYMEINDIKEKIEDYLQLGFKQILSKAQEQGFKWMSIIFFVIGLIPIFGMGNFVEFMFTRKGDWSWLMMFLPLIALVGVSFIFDIILIADKIKERKYRI